MNRSGRTSLLTILLLFASAAGPLLPHLTAEQDSFSFSGNSTSISLAEGRQRTILNGDARISSETLTIEADRIELYGEEFRYARCSGNVKVKESDQKISLTSDSLFLDREQNKLRIRSYSEMVDLTNEIVVKSGYMEHYDEEDYSIFQIGVRILKASEDGRMVCRSDYARYDRGADTLELSGSPVVFWKGDRYSAVRITINLETDEIEMEGNVEGEFTSRTEEEPADGAADNSQE